MRRLAVLFALTLLLAMSGAAFAAMPRVGKAAPAFHLQNSAQVLADLAPLKAAH